MSPENSGEKIIQRAVTRPYSVIMENAGITNIAIKMEEGHGIDAITGKVVNMKKTGIIDPLLVTKTALKNAVSVASTILSADCIVSNRRIDE
jgi:chaperonin GroEL